MTRPTLPPVSPGAGPSVPVSSPSRSSPGLSTPPGPEGDTLKPPAWAGPRSVSTLALERLSEESPVSRRAGNRAEAAHLRGRLAECRRLGDADGERAASRDLARLLSRQGTELDSATHLARHALLGTDDPRLRAELSSWYGLLGEPSLAAATLRPLLSKLVGVRSARVLVRAAVLQGRAGEPSGAAASLRAAASADTKDPIPCELLGALRAWAPAVVASREAAEAYLEGARRREERNDTAGAFEDLLRAFEAAPELPRVADRMVSALTERGAKTAADEVLRDHARAWKQRSRAVHFRRYREAMAEGAWPRALAAAFDAGLDRAIVPEEVCRTGFDDGVAVSFDALLRRVGLPELRVARLQLAARGSEGTLRGQCLLAMAEIYRTELSRYSRAVDCWLSALTADATSEEALAGLERYAEETGDYAVLADGLCRILEEDSAVTTCARRLLVLADEKLCDPSLSLFAARRLREFGESTGALSVEERVERTELQSGALSNVRNRIARAEGTERAEWLGQLVAALRSRPDMHDECVNALSDWYDITREDGVRQSLLRMLEQHGRRERLERFLEQDSRSTTDPEAALRLARFYVAEGRFKDALPVISEPVAEPGLERERAALVLALASYTGAERARADALLELGALCPPSLSAELCCVASEDLWSQGDLDAARVAAERACLAAPNQARSTLAYARASEGLHTRVVAVALERAIGTVVPEARWCRRLAETLEQLGDFQGSLTWTQRWLALCPGDVDASRLLLARATTHGEAAPLGDALAWLLTQAQPLLGMRADLCRALERLSEIDTERALATARRMLDVFGARVPEVRDAVRRVASRLGERGLFITVIERELAAGAGGEERRGRLLELARLRGGGGDVDGAARALVRALREGAERETVREIFAGLGEPRTTDGEVSRLNVRAELATRGDDPEGASAWRKYGAALWDLAQDRPGAIDAWERAAAIDPSKGYEHLARDLVAFLGAAEAGRRLRVLADAKADRKVAGRILVVGAAVALAHGAPREALAFALDALERDPTRADALAIAEGAARHEDGPSLARAYEMSLTGVMGKYGERSLYYRAARQFERRGEFTKALGYAVQAFEAIPRLGVSYVLMVRLSQRVGETAGVVAAIERVASLAAPEERAEWLSATVSLGGGGVSGERQKIHVLLRGLATTPQPDIVKALASSMQALLRAEPSEVEAQHIRFENAVDHLLGRKLSAIGEELLLESALAALTVFEDVELAHRILAALWLEHPLGTGYARLLPHAEQLAAASQGRDRFLELAQKGDGERGHPALAFASVVAAQAGASGISAALLVSAALAPGADDALIHRAEHAAQISGNPQLLRRMQAALPLDERLAVLKAELASAEAAGDFGSAVRYLDAARDAEGGDVPELVLLTARVRDWLHANQRHRELAQDLRSELIYVGDAKRKLDALVRLSDALVASGDFGAALAALADALELEPDHVEMWRLTLTTAERAGDVAWQCECLGRLIELTPEASLQLSMLQQLAPLLDSVGDEPGAVRRYNDWLRLEADAAPAWDALEKFATRREDWQGLCELLGRRLRETADPAVTRACQIKLARILELRLGRPHAAREQLQNVLADTPDDLTVLPQLADLTERLGDPLHAAQLWGRALVITRDRDQTAQYAARACAAFLAGGDVEAARSVLERDARDMHSERICELRVEVARRSDDPPRLGDALEQMARHSTAPPRERAALWVESARVSLDAGSSETALARARRSAEVAPHAAEPQLMVEALEYARRGGPGDSRRAQSTVDALRGVSEVLSASQHERLAFFLAEALDILGRRDAALRELREARNLHGALPLIALGLAERTAEGESPADSLEWFSIALASDLAPVRQRGVVALGAARAAHRGGQHLRALEFVQVAAALPESEREARELLEKIQAALVPADPVQVALASASPVELRASAKPVPSEVPVSPRVGTTDRPLELTDADVASVRDSKLAPGARSGAGKPAAPVATTPETPSPSRAAPPRPQQRPQVTVVGLGASAVPRALPARPFAAPAVPSFTPLPGPAAASPGGSSSGGPPAADSIHEALQVAAQVGASNAPGSPVVVRPVVEVGSLQTPVIEAKIDREAQRSIAPPPARLEATPHGPPVVPSLTRPVGVPTPSPPPPTAKGLGIPSILGPRAASSAPPRLDSGLLASVQEAAAPGTVRGLGLGVGGAPRSLPPELSGLSPADSSKYRAVREDGDLGAAGELYRSLERDPARSHELVAVCRQAWAVDPGNMAWLRRLQLAAVKDDDPVYANALLHAEKTLAREGRVVPPSLGDVVEHSDVRELLFRGQLGTALTAISVVWAQARQLFRKPLARYGVTERSRVSADGKSPLAEAYGEVVRLFGAGRTAAFSEMAEEPGIAILLVEPPAVLLRGTGTGKNLNFEVAVGVAAAQAETALAAGLDDRQLAQLLSALQLAFGAPAVRRGSALAALNLAERLWETIPARGQRELKALCEAEPEFELDKVRADLRHLGRRAGLLATGDLTTALKRFFSEEKVPGSEYVDAGGVQRLCREHSGARDLVFLATSPEYAEARWRTMADPVVRSGEGAVPS